METENPWFEDELEEALNGDISKIVRTGWPMEYMPTLLHNFKQSTKRDLIVFPHRIAPEKQVDIFRDIANSLPQYEFVVCQDQNLTKDQYHNILSSHFVCILKCTQCDQLTQMIFFSFRVQQSHLHC